MSEQQPEPETRGGKNIDWAKAEPGQPLPEKTPPPDEAQEDDGPYDPARYADTTGPGAP